MPGYLDQYGAGEDQRENFLRNSILLALGTIILIALAIYTFRTFHQVRVTKHFLTMVKDRNYEAAYKAWGCATPEACPGYSYDKFLEDWGPKSAGASSPVLRIRDSEGCGLGVILTVEVSPGNVSKLWMQKNSDGLSYSPVNVCPGKGPWTVMMHRTVGRLRQVFF